MSRDIRRLGTCRSVSLVRLSVRTSPGVDGMSRPIYSQKSSRRLDEPGRYNRDATNSLSSIAGLSRRSAGQPPVLDFLQASPFGFRNHQLDEEKGCDTD